MNRHKPTVSTFEALEEKPVTPTPKETPPERWRADFRAALNGILSNPETRVANYEENVLRAGRYADECALFYEMKRSE